MAEHPNRNTHTARPWWLGALLACAGTALAQVPVQQVTVTGRATTASRVGVAGFGDVPLARLPLSATVLSAEQLADAGMASLGDITRLDAGITDAYNAPGYWGQVAVRGFTLDNRYNYRRDGLPINAETMLPLANKAALELLKGTSGIQAGTSAPGGLLNLVVKRPTVQPQRLVALELTQPGTVTASADLGDRLGTAGSIGWRLNASATRHDPMTRHSRGHAHLLAGAVNWRTPGGTLLEAEFEHSLQSQPSTPGLSLLGASGQLPDTGRLDPRLNLNHQAWSLPVVMAGHTWSLRLTQPLGELTTLTAHLMRQRLNNDDRIAFPYGCAREGLADRYCSDGGFDLWDFRSNGEQRTSQAATLELATRARLAGMAHHLGLGLLATHFQARFNDQAFNPVGESSLWAPVALNPDPTLFPGNTNRRERSTEWHLQDRVELAPAWTAWLGLRHSRIARRSEVTDGSAATAYQQRLNTPWLALSWQPGTNDTAYASWGQGVESTVVPNLAVYTNRGEPLPLLKSRQLEAGWKHRGDRWQWQLALFDIQRPQWSDDCSAGPCTRRLDGHTRHRGLEATADWLAGPWNLRASATALRARREAAASAAESGLTPTNVPERSLKAQAVYNLPALPGLALLGLVTHEGRREVLPQNGVTTPGWTRIDLGLRYTHETAGARLVWRLGVDNAANRRAWKEAPYQFGHAYLYPLAPRTWHASVQARL